MFRRSEDFEILHGDLQGLSDTTSFLKSLDELDAVYDSKNNTEKRQMREHKAAAGLFNWEVSFISTRSCCWLIYLIFALVCLLLIAMCKIITIHMLSIIIIPSI